MPYHLSASKLQIYSRCPRAYYFKYEHGLEETSAFGSAALGTALHQALAKVYKEWNYLAPLPKLEWMRYCWDASNGKLSAGQQAEGWEILENYYDQFIASLTALKRPLQVEGKISGRLEVCNIEFVIQGRYDRLDFLDDGLELIDYKSNKKVKQLDEAEIDVQLGLYYLALAQKYQKSLHQLTLLYLRAGEKITFDVTPQHQKTLESVVADLALKLRDDHEWEPCPGEQCDRCAFARYCSAATDCPEPLPDGKRKNRSIQLNLAF